MRIYLKLFKLFIRSSFRDDFNGDERVLVSLLKPVVFPHVLQIIPPRYARPLHLNMHIVRVTRHTVLPRVFRQVIQVMGLLNFKILLQITTIFLTYINVVINVHINAVLTLIFHIGIREGNG